MPGLNTTNVDQFCASIDLSQERPLIDLSQVTWIDTYALIYLGLYIRHFNSNGTTFGWRCPTRRSVRNYLARQQFYKHFNFDPKFVQDEHLICTPSSTCWNDIKEITNERYIAEYIADEVRDLLFTNGVRTFVNDISEIAAEVVQNFAEHSTQERAVVTIQWFPRLKWLTLAVGDCGIGVKTALSSKYPKVAKMPDLYAIVEAFKPGITSKYEGGTGLTNIEQTVIQVSGSLFFSSNGGYLKVAKGKRFIGDMTFNYPGVQIAIGFPAEA